VRIRPCRSFFCGLALAGLWSAPANAGELRVEAAACPDLDGARVQSLLEVEVRPVLDAHPDLPDLVLVTSCSGPNLVLAVTDPVTEKRLERTMPAPAPDDPERERVIAFAAAQLFHASWLELSSPPPKEEERADADEAFARPPPEPPAVSEPEEKAAKAAATVATTTDRDRRGPHELWLRADVRWRDLAAPTLMNHGGVRYGHRLPHHFTVWGEALAGFGRASRRLGYVDVLDVMAGAGAGWRTPMFGPLTVDLELGGAFVYERLAGHSDTGISTGVVAAPTGEVGGAVGLTLHARWLLASLMAQGGFLFPGPTGRVEGEADVDPDGGWLGVGLRIGGVVTPRR
jgi:hypothetical protein